MVEYSDKWLRGGDVIWIRQLDCGLMLASKTEIRKFGERKWREMQARKAKDKIRLERQKARQHKEERRRMREASEELSYNEQSSEESESEDLISEEESENFEEDIQIISIENATANNADTCMMTKAMWVVENLNKTDGSPIEWNRPFRLLSLAK